MEIENLRKDHVGFAEAISVLHPTALSETELKVILTYREQANIKTVVAVEDGVVVGTASMIPEYKFLHGGSKAGHIEDVAVLESHQGKGVGKKLIDHLLSYAEKNGFYRVGLSCKEDIALFYGKCGFDRQQTYMIYDIPGNYRT